jgi:hypothetical protein
MRTRIGTRRSATIVLLACALGLAASHARAAQRTFVASTGADANPCTLGEPCRSFGAAIAKVNDGGDVVVLDSAGYGPFTVTKSVTVTAPLGIYAGIAVPADQHGVTIDAPGAVVVLRGLSIVGAGCCDGIHFAHGAELRVERAQIGRLTNGIYADLSGGAMLSVVDTALSANVGVWLHGAGHASLEDVRFVAATSVYVDDMADAMLHRLDAATSGLAIGAQTASTTATVSHSRFRIEWCGGVGVSSSAPVVAAVIRDTEVTGSCTEGAFPVDASAGVARATLVRNRVDAAFPAVVTSGAGASVYLDADVFAANPGAGNAISIGGGPIYTRGNNTVWFTSVDQGVTPYSPR